MIIAMCRQAWLSLLFAISIFGNAVAADPADGAKRMLVMLAPSEVARQPIRESDRIETIFPDQRFELHPKMWGAVSLKTAAMLREMESKYSIKPILAFGNLSHGFAASLTPQEVETLKSDYRVMAIYPDAQGKRATWFDAPTSSPTTSSTYVRGWNLIAIGLTDSGTGPTADIATPSTSYLNYRDGTYPVRAYLIDTAIGLHEDLNFSLADLVNFDCDQTLGANCGSGQYATGNSCDTHATNVAGVLAARRQVPTTFGVEGVAPNALLTSVRILNGCPGNNGGGYTSSLITAINWIASVVPNNGTDENGKRRLSAVCNISIVWDIVTLGGAEIAIRNAVWGAVDAGVFFTFAAGNSNQPADQIYPGAVGYQTAGAMSVGAMKADGYPMDTRPAVPSKIAVFNDSIPSVEIWAPGQDVHTTAVFLTGMPAGANMPNPWGTGGVNPPFSYGQNYYARESGSSLAAPHVAGAALLIGRKFQKAGVPPPSPQGIEWIIQNARQNNVSYWQHPGISPPKYSTVNLLKIDGL